MAKFANALVIAAARALLALVSFAGCEGDERCRAGDNGDAAELLPPEAMVRVPAGSFRVGPAPDSDAWSWVEGGFSSHGVVTFTYDLLVGASLVTNEQWDAVMDDNPSPGRDQECRDCPVHGLTPLNMVAYLNRRSLQEGYSPCYEFPSCDRIEISIDPFSGDTCGVTVLRQECDGYRLLSMFEFERVARAGAETSFWCGEDGECLFRREWMVDLRFGSDQPVLEAGLEYRVGDDVYAAPFYADRDRPVGPQRSGTSCPNQWGFYDTHAHMAEIVWHSSVWGDVNDAVDPNAAETSYRYGIRGYGFANRGFLASYMHANYQPGNEVGLGFRVARRVDAP